MQTKLPKLAFVLPLAALLFSGAGCTHTYNTPKSLVTGYPHSEKIPIAIELRVADPFRNAKWEKHMMGDTFVIPIGDNLCRNSEALAQQLFSRVIVTDGASAQLAPGADAVLIPRVAALEQTMGVWASSEVSTTILLEWTLKDANTNVIWVDTIKGEAEGAGGNAFTANKHAEERVKGMIDAVFQKSFGAISEAQAIRRFRPSIRQAGQ